ncbi:MAG: TIGR03084 family protein, partial [Oscillospiraceae bacterium]|nr:TIGR03084 family protein [Oscillospiraceae bacterium]
PMYLELTLPSGEKWIKGEPNEENYIKGSAKDWAMVSVRRRHWMDTELEVVGDEARRYANVVQCYAGAADPLPEAKRQR